MSNNNSEHSEAATEKLRIEQLSEDPRELSNEQSKAIAGGRSKLEMPNFDLLESIQGVLSKLGPRNLSH